jgi:hypothetical protein
MYTKESINISFTLITNQRTDFLHVFFFIVIVVIDVVINVFVAIVVVIVVTVAVVVAVVFGIAPFIFALFIFGSLFSFVPWFGNEHFVTLV